MGLASLAARPCQPPHTSTVTSQHVQGPVKDQVAILEIDMPGGFSDSAQLMQVTMDTDAVTAGLQYVPATSLQQPADPSSDSAFVGG